jgi:hypothetical protein
MSKRKSVAEEHHVDDSQRPNKRPRTEPSGDIQSARQLRALLTFQQDAVSQLRKGMASPSRPSRSCSDMLDRHQPVQNIP